MFKKILIANRGEIAVRIIRACREMGILTVAVCSNDDKDALHSQLADETICIGSALAKDSYLNMERILSATIATKAEAIHPGFGFLSENSKFVKMCEKCNITFIGPSANLIEKMGDKLEARKIMLNANIPVILGSDEAVSDVFKAKEIAKMIGYPVIIKSSGGGGGKGIKVVLNEQEFEEKFNLAKYEVENSFSNGKMYIEKYIKNARHIEVQILADKYGNTLYLGERDCSIQRRHQKLIEESPSIAIDEDLRKKIGEMAVRISRIVGYYNVGTIEFLLDNDNNFYFMEMNTRIQVEHPVTEMVTGIDLIKEQIKIASGEKLKLKQSDIKLRGYAIECRINAENPNNNFMPCVGTIENVHLPDGKDIRVDTAIYNNYKISPFYDSMIAKLIVRDDTRELAIKKMKSALGELSIDGVKTNLDYLYEIITDEDFINGKIDTEFIERNNYKFLGVEE